MVRGNGREAERIYTNIQTLTEVGFKVTVSCTNKEVECHGGEGMV